MEISTKGNPEGSVILSRSWHVAAKPGSHPNVVRTLDRLSGLQPMHPLIIRPEMLWMEAKIEDD